jgi:hypothetical protein
MDGVGVICCHWVRKNMVPSIFITEGQVQDDLNNS